jgi:hypothetical protein
MAPTTRNALKEKPKATISKKSNTKTSKKVTEGMPVSASVRGEVSSTTDATGTLLEDVLKRNGEEHLLDKIMELAKWVEDDPPVIFGWESVDVFVQAIQAAQAQAAAPGGLPLPACPLALPAAVNVKNFKADVLEYARVPGVPARLGSTCLACTQAQFGNVASMLTRLDLNPWIRCIIAVGVPNSLPIANLFVSRLRSNTLDIVMADFPNSLWEEADFCKTERPTL